MVKITLPDNSTKEFKNEITGLDIANSISKNLAEDSIAIKVNKKLQDLSKSIKEDSKVEILTTKNKESLEVLWHTTAHIFAQALLRIFPKAKISNGPPIEEGFYYDFDEDNFEESDLEKVEKEMKKIIEEKINITINHKNLQETFNFFKDNKYKTKILENITQKEKQENFKFYKQKEFEDLCKGPHLLNTSFVKSFKLLKLTKAYFLGDSNNKQINRVYGISFFKKSELEKYLKMKEEAKKRDHKILCKKLKIYTISELVGSGLPMFKKNGVFIRNQIENFLWELHKNEGYQKVWTPHIAKTDLYKKSGHYEMYEENFRVKGKDSDFMMKPMNCPHHMQIFDSETYSYKDMPIRFFEPGTVYRDELSGTLTGLTRVRAITQDDGHLFIRESQIKQEIKTIVKIIKKFYEVFDMKDFWVSLSIRDLTSTKYLGDKKIWEKAEKKLEEVCKELKLNFQKIEGEASFYGPKLDFMFKDSMNRTHQLSTIQLDFNLPNRFNLSFINEKNEKEMPIVIHRAIGGSIERCMALLIEHFEGKMPLWISPNQIMILNVADRHQQKCLEIQKLFRENDFLCDINFDNETISNKIRLAQQEKYNYIIVIGEKEINSKDIFVRDRKNKTTKYKLENFLEKIKIEKNEKLLDIEKNLENNKKNKMNDNKKNNFIYFNTETISEINKNIVENFKKKGWGHKGDSYNLKNRTNLNNILDKCKNSKKDIYNKAIILLKELCQSHPFESANRRTAYYSTLSFLLTNKQDISIHKEYDNINANFMTGIREGKYYTDEELIFFLKKGKIKEFKRL